MKHDLVLFDLDEVLVDYDQHARLQLLSERSGTSPERVHAALTLSGFENESDHGLWPGERHAEELSRRLGATLALQDCIDARAASMRARPPMLRLAQAVSAHAHVAILTNNGSYMIGRMHEICPPLFPLFAGAIHFAAEYGVIKPDPETYARCLQARGDAPARTLFIDDKPENVAGARSAGLEATVFSGHDALVEELREYGLLAQ